MLSSSCANGCEQHQPRGAVSSHRSTQPQEQHAHIHKYTDIHTARVGHLSGRVTLDEVADTCIYHIIDGKGRSSFRAFYARRGGRYLPYSIGLSRARQLQAIVGSPISFFFPFCFSLHICFQQNPGQLSYIEHYPYSLEGPVDIFLGEGK